MNKLLFKNKKLRAIVKTFKTLYFIISSIIKNTFIFQFSKLKILLFFKNYFKSTCNYTALKFCVVTLNKQKFNKVSMYSRQWLLRVIQNGEMFGVSKQLW